MSAKSTTAEAERSFEELVAERTQALALAQAADVEIERIQMVEIERDFEAANAADVDFHRTYSDQAYAARVTEARRKVEEALAADPVVVALAELLHAQMARAEASSRVHSVRARLEVEDVDLGALVPVPGLGPIADLYARAAERLAGERLNADRAAWHEQRQAYSRGTTEAVR